MTGHASCSTIQTGHASYSTKNGRSEIGYTGIGKKDRQTAGGLETNTTTELCVIYHITVQIGWNQISQPRLCFLRMNSHSFSLAKLAVSIMHLFP